MQEFVLIGMAIIVFAVLVKIGLKVLKWGIIALILYGLWRIFMH